MKFDSKTMTLYRLGGIVFKFQQHILQTFAQDRTLAIATLNARELQVLAILSRCAVLSPNGLPLKVLAARLNMTAPATSLMVSSMVRKHLVSRRMSRKDRRSVQIKLSARGEACVKKIIPIVKNYAVALYADLTAEESAVFSAAVEKMYGQFYAENEEYQQETEK